MKKITYLFTAIVIITLISSCNKQPLQLNSEEATTFNFVSLEADSPIPLATQGNVVAVAEGENLTYEWSVTPVGDLHGSGSSIKFSSCCDNTYQITCTVSDGTSTESKLVTVIVEP
jgi:hypothetical protein